MAFSQDQYNIAGQFIKDNIDNPALVNAELAKYGATQQDILQAARTVDPNIQASQVAQYTGYTPPQRQGVSLNAYQKNPYLDQMAAGITQQATRNLNENILPGVRSNSIASGGFGGSRQGIAEGLAMGRTNDALTNSLANLYGTDYTNQMNRNLQQYGMELQNALGMGQLDAQNRSIDNQYSLGLGGLNNQRYGIDQTYNLGMTNAANSRYGTDKQYEVGMAGANASMANAAASQAQAANNFALGQQQLGMSGLFGLLDRQYQYGQGAQNTANNMQNTPLNYWQQFGQGANALGQNGGSSMTTQQQASNPYATMLGGAQLANAWFNQAPAPTANSAGGANTQGFGTGSGFGNQDLGTYF